MTVDYLATSDMSRYFIAMVNEAINTGKIEYDGEEVEVKKTEAIERRKKKREERLNKRKELLQDKKDIEIERQVELEEKEHYLLEQEKQTKLAKMVAMLEDNLK